MALKELQLGVADAGRRCAIPAYDILPRDERAPDIRPAPGRPGRGVVVRSRRSDEPAMIILALSFLFLMAAAVAVEVYLFFFFIASSVQHAYARLAEWIGLATIALTVVAFAELINMKVFNNSRYSVLLHAADLLIIVVSCIVLFGLMLFILVVAASISNILWEWT